MGKYNVPKHIGNYMYHVP